MKICRVYYFVPTSCRILDTQLKKLEVKPFDEQSNVWAGTYTKAGHNPDKDPEFVSIKVLSRDEASQEKVRKVSVPWSS